MYAGCSIAEWGGETYYTTGPRLQLTRYKVIRHTPKGVWLEDGICELRWVSSTARRRLAYPTEEQALQSFAARKRRQIEILTKQLERAQRALRLVEHEESPNELRSLR